MVENEIKQKQVWSYRDRPGKAAGAVAGVMVSALIAVALLSRGFSKGVCVLYLSVMLGVWFFFRNSLNVTIEIDLDKGTVLKKEKRWFSEKLSTYLLRDFNKVKMTGHDARVEEGYGDLRYVIALEGPGAPLAVYSTEDEQQGKMIQQMLIPYLSLPKEQAQGGAMDITTTRKCWRP